LLDHRDYFQLEIFEFENPPGRPLPPDRSIVDVGYNRLIFAVRSLTAFQQRLAKARYPKPLVPMEQSESSHVSLEDPDGIRIELIEQPEWVASRREITLVGVGVTTVDLQTSVEDFTRGLGFELLDADPFDHRRYWDHRGNLESAATLRKGDMSLVLAQYRSSRPRRQDYRLADIGILNIALGFREQADFLRRFDKARQQDFSQNCKPLMRGKDIACVYVNDRQNLSVEMLQCQPELYGLVGFRKPRLRDRLVNYLQERRALRLAG
jgi:catechol 2,3-dioxygenase-like lactoylglutathione lyase family enzyme